MITGGMVDAFCEAAGIKPSRVTRIEIVPDRITFHTLMLNDDGRPYQVDHALAVEIIDLPIVRGSDE